MPEPFRYVPSTRAEFAQHLERVSHPNSRYIAGIVLHHTASPSQALAARYGNEKTVRAIYNGHTGPKPGGRGWPHIAYHFIILPDGIIADGCPVQKIGYHASTWNGPTIGVSMIGNFDTDGGEHPTPEQIASTAAVLRRLAARFNIPLGQDYIHGKQEGLGFHRDEPYARRDGKMCPGDTISKWAVRQWLTNALPADEEEDADPTPPTPDPVLLPRELLAAVYNAAAGDEPVLRALNKFRSHPAVEEMMG